MYIDHRDPRFTKEYAAKSKQAAIERFALALDHYIASDEPVDDMAQLARKFIEDDVILCARNAIQLAHHVRDHIDEIERREFMERVEAWKKASEDKRQVMLDHEDFLRLCHYATETKKARQ